MPLSAKGKKILAAMTSPVSQGGYGKKKGKQVFYASQNKGTIKGTELHNPHSPYGDIGEQSKAAHEYALPARGKLGILSR